MARVHPELTMPVFSEVTDRFQTGRPAVRQSLLRCLLPWLRNMELVDPHLVHQLPHRAPFEPAGAEHREGWGSAEATEMVLNNLFYVTAKFGDEHPKVGDPSSFSLAARLRRGGQHVSRTGVCGVPLCPCFERGPKVPTNDVAKAGMSCGRMVRSSWLVVQVPSQARAHESVQVLQLPWTLKLESNLPHLPLLLCHRQDRSQRQHDSAATLSDGNLETTFFGCGQRPIPGTVAILSAKLPSDC